MPTIELSSTNIRDAIREAVSTLRKGGIIAYPTETLYGLGVKYDDEKALARLYELKRRPHEKTIPIIIGHIGQLELLAGRISGTARGLMEKFWPGPLTLVFDARSGLNRYITCADKIAVRIPGRSFALDLAQAAGFPFTATSANISGMPPAGNAAMVAEYFDDSLDLVIDGGQCTGAEPSTIVDVTREPATVLREGAICSSRLFVR